MLLSGGNPRTEGFGFSKPLLKLKEKTESMRFRRDKVDLKEKMYDLPLVFQGFCYLSINSDSVDIKGSGFGEELHQTSHLLQK